MRSSSHWQRVLLLVLLVAFALRMVSAVNNLQVALAPDEKEYTTRAAVVARDIRADRGVFRPPLYPYALAVVYRTVGDDRFVVNAFQGFLDTFNTALVFLLALAWNRKRGVAVLAAFLFAVSPQAVGLSGALLSEPLFIFLLLAGFLLVTRAVRAGNTLVALGGGMVLALASLTREVTAYFALAVIPVWWLLFSTRPLRAQALATAAFLLGMIVVLTPWVVRNYGVEGRLLLLSTSGEIIFARDNIRTVQLAEGATSAAATAAGRRAANHVRELPAGQQTGALYRAGLDAIRANPLGWLVHKTAVVGGFWSVSRFERVNLGVTALPKPWQPPVVFLIRAYFVALIVFGTLGMVAAPNNSFKLLVGLFLVYSLVLFILTHYQLRYRYPVYVLLTPYVAYGMWTVSQLFRTRRFDSRWISAPRLLLALVTLACFIPLID